MPDPARQLHLNLTFLSAGYYPCAWRLPGSDPLALVDVAHFRNVARIAERGTLDSLFFADYLSVPPEIAHAAPLTPHEPTVLLTAIAGATERIGLIATASTTYNEPYNVARRFASVDHVSGGRAGWNVVSSYSTSAADNFGPAQLPTHAERYARAAEFVDVVLALWGSWGPGGLVGDKASGVFASFDHIEPIDHVGAHYEVRGPLNVPPSPQGRPVVLQAGASPAGMALGARTADAIFTTQRFLPEAIAFREAIRRGAGEHGRDPDAVKVLPGLVMVIGGTEAEARARQAELEALLDVETARDALARLLGTEPERLPLDERLPASITDSDAAAADGSQSLYADTVKLAVHGDLTVRELVYGLAGRFGHPLVVGTPEQIADRIEHWFREGAADGFNLMPDVLPSGLEAFVDHVVPELRRRGIFRTEYEGSTLRSHYGLPMP